MSELNQASESEIRQAIAESGKMSVREMMGYLKVQMKKPYCLKLARKNAKELAAEMKAFYKF